MTWSAPSSVSISSKSAARRFGWALSLETEYSREIGLIEVRDQYMQSFECKHNLRQKDNGGIEFQTAYPDCPIKIVAPETLDPSLL